MGRHREYAAAERPCAKKGTVTFAFGKLHTENIVSTSETELLVKKQETSNRLL